MVGLNNQIIDKDQLIDKEIEEALNHKKEIKDP